MVAMGRAPLYLRDRLPADRPCSSCSPLSAVDGFEGRLEGMLQLVRKGGMVNSCGGGARRYLCVLGSALNGTGTTVKWMTNNRTLCVGFEMKYIMFIEERQVVVSGCFCPLYLIMSSSGVLHACGRQMVLPLLQKSAGIACCRCNLPTTMYWHVVL